MNALVSVIIPIYNASEYIGHTMECLLAQSYDHLEVIAVNDTSTDNTSELLNGYAQAFKDKGIELRIVTRQQNGGLCAAINDGIASSTGDYLCFPDADDELHPDYVSAMMETLKKHPDKHWVRCNYTIVLEEEDREYNVLLPEKSVYADDYYDFISKFIPHNAWNMIVSKRYFSECIGERIYDSRLTQEWSLLLPLSYSSDYARCTDVLYRYHIRKNAMSSWQNKDIASVIKHINDLEQLNHTVIDSIGISDKERLDVSAQALHIYYSFMRHKKYIQHGLQTEAEKELLALKQACDGIICKDISEIRKNTDMYVRLVFDRLMSADTSGEHRKYEEYKQIFADGYEIFTDAPGAKLMDYVKEAYGEPVSITEHDSVSPAADKSLPKACLIENSQKYRALKEHDHNNGIYIDYRDLRDSIRGWSAEKRLT